MWQKFSYFVGRTTAAVFLPVIAGLFAAPRYVEAAEEIQVVDRYLSQLTFIVAKVDTSRVDLVPVVERLAESFPEGSQVIRDVGGQTAAFWELLRSKLHGQSVHVVVRWMVVPGLFDASGGTGLERRSPGLIGKFFELAREDVQLPLLVAAEPGIIIAPSPEGRLPEPPAIEFPMARPEFEMARRAVADWPIQILIAPPPHARRAFEELMPELPPALGGGPVEVLTEGLLWAAIGIDPQELSVTVVIQSQSPEAAARLAKWLPGALERVGKALNEQLAEINKPANTEFELLVEALSPGVEGDRVVTRFRAEGRTRRLLAMYTTAVARTFHIATLKRETLQKMKQIAAALHAYYQEHQHFPPPTEGRDKQGKQLLSWRVYLLPYLGEKELYEQFHLDEPWDSPHNLPLRYKMPEVYRSPSSVLRTSATPFVVPKGEDTVFAESTPGTFSQITDGASNTIFIVAVKDQRAVCWTTPRDYLFNPEKPAADLRDFEGKFPAAFFDGSARMISRDIGPETILHLFQKSDGHVVELP